MRSARLACALILVAACGDDSGGGGGGDGGGDDGGGDDAPPGDADSSPAVRSAGCGMATTTMPATFTKRTVDADGPRDLWVRVPEGYDSTRAYPVIYQLHGCSDSPMRELNNVPLDNQVGDDAILVRARAASNCWSTSATGPDVPYIDAMMTDVEGAFCVDTSRRFLTGYSSGSFMTNALSCIRGDKFRGVATIAGGPGGGNACTGNPAALLIHDADDLTVLLAQGIAARDTYLMRNECTMPPVSMPTDHEPCVEYQGCAAGKPVVWCETSGRNHDRQDSVAGPIFWWFIQSLL